MTSKGVKGTHRHPRSSRGTKGRLTFSYRGFFIRLQLGRLKKGSIVDQKTEGGSIKLTSYQGTSSIVKVRGLEDPLIMKLRRLQSRGTYYFWNIPKPLFFDSFMSNFLHWQLEVDISFCKFKNDFEMDAFLTKGSYASFVAKGVVCPSISIVIFHAFRQKHWGI